MNREVLKWCDEKFEDLKDKPGQPVKKCKMLKAFGIGAVEGFVDGLTIVGAYSIILGGIVIISSKFKK